MKKITLILSLVLLTFFSVYGDSDSIGEIVYLTGDVELTRDGNMLYPDEIEVGMIVENYDVVRTYGDGNLSIKLKGGKSPGAELVISPNTVFSIEQESIESGNNTSVNLMSGGLSLKVEKLTGKMSLDVVTEAASMGVRGTTFTVESSPSGELLVSCEEGKVECKSSAGKKLFAEPGQIVENTGDTFRRIPVAVTDIKKYRKEWMADKMEVFKADALRAMKQYAGLYDDMYEKFISAYESLVSHKKVLDKWFKEDAAGKIGSNMDLMKEKKEIIGALFDLRKNLFIFEKIYYRVDELYTYHQQGYGKGFVKPGVTVQAFFNKFAREKKELAKKMAIVKHVTKMFAKRNGGSFAVDAFEQDDDFFGDDGF